MFSWMAWTLPVAVFFSCIVLMLVGMTLWELRSPTVMRKGWLPMATTRGDRLFIGLLLAAYVNLADRKSTRLNSSHLVISYAVFCLKKKKALPDHNASSHMPPCLSRLSPLILMS